MNKIAILGFEKSPLGWLFFVFVTIPQARPHSLLTKLCYDYGGWIV